LCTALDYSNGCSAIRHLHGFCLWERSESDFLLASQWVVRENVVEWPPEAGGIVALVITRGMLV